MSNDVQEPETEEPEGGNRRLDPELRQLGQIIRALDGMDDGARSRCVCYLWSRYAGGVKQP
jgi:hypothetical protein